MATITKRGKSYRVRAYDGYGSDGKQIERTMTWTPPEDWSEKRADKEALRQSYLFEEKIKNGEIANGKMKLCDFADYWFSRYAEKNLRRRTTARYRELMVDVNDALGHLRLEQIRPAHLLDFYDHMAQAKPKNTTFCCTFDLKKVLKDRRITQAAFSKQYNISLTTIRTAFHKEPISHKSAEKISAALQVPFTDAFQPSQPLATLSGNTVRHYHSFISSMLGSAVEWQFIPYNPCCRVAPPKADSPEIIYLDDEQTKHMLQLLKKEPEYLRRAAACSVLSGMRRGELLGIEWKDFDWEGKRLDISRTSQYLPGEGVFTDETKNDGSTRYIPLSDQEIALYQEQYLWQRRQAKLLGAEWTVTDRVFTYEDGRPLRPDRLSTWFKNFVRHSDLPDIHLHSLRHTCATLRIADGDAVTTVAKQLGHADPTTTLQIYAHAISAAQVESSSKMGSRFKDYL